MQSNILTALETISSIVQPNGVLVTVTKDELLFEAGTESKTVFIKAKTKNKNISNIFQTSKDQIQFGINKLPSLIGLMNFPSYKTEESTFKVIIRKNIQNIERVEEFVFSDGKGGSSIFRLANANSVPPQPKFMLNSFDVSFTIDDSKKKEFSQLSRIFSSVENSFVTFTKEDGLYFGIGDVDPEHIASDTAILKISNETGTLPKNVYNLRWSLEHFLSSLRGENLNINVSSKGGMIINFTINNVDFQVAFSQGSR